MYITNQSLAEKMINQNKLEDSLIEKLLLTKSILAKYGKIIFTAKYISMISSIDQDLSSMITLLKETSKHRSSQIQNLIDTIKKLRPDYTKVFDVQIQAGFEDKLSSIINAKFPKNIKKISNTKNTIKISGEGMYYNRNLNKDLEKMLKQ